MRMIQRWEFLRIPDKEDRLQTISIATRPTTKYTDRVVEHKVLVALVGVELHRESMDIARGVGRASFSSDSRNAHDAFCFLADLVQEAGRGEVGAVMGDLEGPKCTAFVSQVLTR